MSSEKAESKSPPWKLIIGGVVLIGLFVSYFVFDGGELLKQFINWIKSLGYWGPVVFIAAYTLLTVFMIPGSVLTLGAGFAFGLGWGSVWTIIGANLGANLAFLVGRFFAQKKIQEKVQSNKKFGAIDEAVAKDGLQIVALTRLAPVFPFTLLNYLYSVTKVKWSSYALATLFGMLPGTIMYVYLGTIGRFAAEGGDKTTGEKVLFAFGLLATVVVTVLVTRKAQKILKEKTGISGDDGGEPSNEQS